MNKIAIVKHPYAVIRYFKVLQYKFFFMRLSENTFCGNIKAQIAARSIYIHRKTN